MARSSGGDARPDQLNMVGEGTVFEGTLRAESNVRVSGHIKGTLDVDGRVIVTQEGVVEGELRATDADVAGSVQGEIHITERLMLKSTARIDGSIAAGRIKVEEGALFAGQCKIGEDVSETVQQQIEAKGASEEERAPHSGSASASSGGAGGTQASGAPANGTTERGATAGASTDPRQTAPEQAAGEEASGEEASGEEASGEEASDEENAFDEEKASAEQ
jgi:cytoskeletal protein CcmA (bactofilin family)